VVKLRQPLDFNQKVNSSCEQQGTKKQNILDSYLGFGFSDQPS
jgi:hypothetical protein